ncbi:hypothetical protein OTK49_01895 [Vibrio coralliirubri]|uniref:hypothetical protein n=1 Tax=Vibrio coralliirubri TaxID=1516159 RepID=UPI0022836E87|nr:hypothetical protein [Vibrio coralliirubri]MCY9861266.1 hypothetical protein [Vibrio coralliirubri]
MYIKLHDFVVKWVDFDQADQRLFECDGRTFESLHELLSSFDDKELALGVHNAVIDYLNRNRPDPLFVLDTLHRADGYDLQWALDKAEKETGLKIEYYGVVNVQKFAGFSSEPVTGIGVTCVEVPKS